MILLACIILIPAGLYAALRLHSVQQWIKDLAQKELSKKINSVFTIGEIDFTPFNSLKLYNVYVEDQKGDTLLYAEKIAAGIDLLPLLRNKLVITSVDLSDFSANISQDSLTAPMNFQFIVDAFASQDTVTKEPSSMEISIDDILISGGRLRYDVKSEPLTPDTFDINHIRIDSLYAEIDLASIDIEKLDAEVKKLTLKEQSGLKIEDIILKVRSDQKVISLNTLKIKLPNSELSASGKVDYTGMELSNIAEKGKIELMIDPSSVLLSDLKAFSPSLSGFSQVLTLDGKVNAELPEINLESLNISLGKDASLKASAFIRDYTNFESTNIKLDLVNLYINENGIQSVIKNFTGETIDLPEQVARLKNIQVSGRLEGKTDNAQINVTVKTDPGNFTLKGTGGYNLASERAVFDVNLETSDFRLNDVLPDYGLGHVSFSIYAKGHQQPNNLFADAQGVIHRLDYQNISYTDIHLKAQADQDKYTANMTVDDSFLKLSLDAAADLPSGRLPEFKVDLKVDRLLPDKMNLLPDYPDSFLSLGMNADLKGDDLDNITGKITVDSLTFISQNGKYKATPILITAGFKENGDRQFLLQNEMLTADISGKMTFTTLSDQLMNTAGRYFPSLFAVQKKTIKPGKNNFIVHIICKNTELLSQNFDLPFSILKESTVDFSYDDSSDNVVLTGNIPSMKTGETAINNIKLDLSNNAGPINMTLTGDMPQNNTPGLHLQLTGKAENDNVDLNAVFDDKSDSLSLDGKINASVLLSRISPKFPLKMTIGIKPSALSYNKLDLTIPASSVIIEEDRFTFDKFRINHTATEFIQANGIYSPSGKDTLSVLVNQIDLYTVTTTLNMDLGLGGLVQGNIDVVGTEKLPAIFTKNLGIRNITLNNEKIGDLLIDSEWANSTEGIKLSALLQRESGVNSEIKGNIFPIRDSVNVNINLEDIHLAWVQPFMKGTLHDMDGSISSKLFVRGNLSNPDLTGYVYVNNGKFGIDFTNVTYTLTDSIVVTPSQLTINNLLIKDSNGKTAKVECNVKHKRFKDISYDLSMDMNDFLVLNTMDKKDSLFYGLLKLTGNIKADGTDSGVNVGLKLRNSSDSKIAVILPESTDATEYKSIVFVDKRSEEEKKAEEAAQKAADTGLNLPIDLDMALNITPDMDLTVFLDPSLSDRATVKGTGNLKMKYNLATSNMNIVGDYIIQEGNCIISLKGITKREFKIREGSKVSLNGDPMKAQFNITAFYAVKADLGTLDQSFTSDPNLHTSQVMVNCVLNVKGNMNKMDISYDIDLPDASDDTKQKVKSFISNDDIMIREFAYLLAVGAFYAPDYATAAKSNNSLWSSVASSTLSTALNSLVSGALGKNWTIGANINSADGSASDLEMDISVSTQLFNNRLILHTNLGYNNSSTAENNFIGDFDAELKLNRSGNLRLKAYNITNDQYYQKAPTTQGVGLVYTREARFFKSLFKKQRRKISSE